MRPSLILAVAHRGWSTLFLTKDLRASPFLTFPKRRLQQRRQGSAHEEKVDRVTTDVTTWEPTRTYDLSHDRAAFHFLTEPKGRAAYAQRLLRRASWWHRDHWDIRPRWPRTIQGIARGPLRRRFVE